MLKKTSALGSIRSKLFFITQFVTHPKEIGAILPSSPLLSKTMADFVPEDQDPFVVELGPGTGPVTQALVNRGLHEDNLFCLEQSDKLVTHLNCRFPNLTIFQGDACELSSLLKEKCGHVSAIVSSLPLKSIPNDIVAIIIEQMHRSLSDTGIVIQFTYDLRRKKSPLLNKFERIHSKFVLRNIPPARVDVFAKK